MLPMDSAMANPQLHTRYFQLLLKMLCEAKNGALKKYAKTGWYVAGIKDLYHISTVIILEN
jgi:hypothetical protein